MICPCGGEVTETEYNNKTYNMKIYTRRCSICRREEKSSDSIDWLPPFAFYVIAGKNA